MPSAQERTTMSTRTIDEMGMYLRKIARTPLLTREGEQAIANRVCARGACFSRAC